MKIFYSKKFLKYIVLVMVFVLLWYLRLSLISNLIIIYLTVSLLENLEIRSLFYGGIFLYFFNFLIVVFRDEQQVNLFLKDYIYLLLLGPVVIFIYRQVVDYLVNSKKTIFNHKKSIITIQSYLGVDKINPLIQRFLGKKKNIIKMINLLLVVLYRFLYLYICKLIKEIKKRGKIFVVKIIILILLFLLLLIFSQIVISNIFVWLFFLAGLFFAWDSRITTSLALFFLFLCSYFLIREQDNLAEMSAIYAYYFLLITIFFSLIEQKRER